MERVYFAEHRGTEILHVNYSGIEDPDQLHALARRALAVVRSHGSAPLLVLADLTGVPHTLVTAAIMQEGVAGSRPHVRARAVLGLSPDAAGSFSVAARLFGQPMERFDDRHSALEWLLENADAPARRPGEAPG